MDNPQERFLLSWLAGIFDGEGYLGLVPHKYKGYLSYEIHSSITNTDFSILDAISIVLKTKEIGFHITEEGNGNKGYKRAYRIMISGFKRNKKFLNLLFPYLVGLKKEKAEICLEYIEHRLKQPKRNRENGRFISSVAMLDKEYYDRFRELVKKSSEANTHGWEFPIR